MRRLVAKAGSETLSFLLNGKNLESARHDAAFVASESSGGADDHVLEILMSEISGGEHSLNSSFHFKSYILFV